MNVQLETEIQDFLKRISSSEMNFGEEVPEEDFDELSAELLEKLPFWQKEMLVKYPLANQVLSIPHINPEFEGVYHMIELIGPEEIEGETLECYPGCAIFEFGYICIGQDGEGMGNSYFISIKEGDNPPVYQIEHDISENGEELLAGEQSMIVKSLSELFKNAEIIQ